MPAERIQKLLAAAGHGSRRKCEELILAGRVAVNGATVTELGSKADLANDQVTFDGKPVLAPRLVYVLMNKPAGVVTTVADPHAQRTVMDLLPRLPAPVYPVGRLDRESEGALLLMNDGELAHRLTHPRYGVEKTYRVTVAAQPTDEQLEKLRTGVRLDDGITAPAKARILGHDASSKWTVEMVVHEGRKHQVRRMFDAVGHPVLRLFRARFGLLSTYKLPRGACRMLSKPEVARLRKMVGL